MRDIVKILQTENLTVYHRIITILTMCGLSIQKDSNNVNAYLVMAEEAQIPILKIWEENDGKRYGVTLPNDYLNEKRTQDLYNRVIAKANELLGDNPLIIR